MTAPFVLVVTGMAFEARIAAGPHCRVVHGVRGLALEQEVSAMASRHCMGILSFGVAGGLEPALAPGDVVLADAVCAPGERYDTDTTWTRALHAALPHARIGTAAGADQPVLTVAAKASLHRATGALCVDMESHLAARMASACRLPFAACRVIVDPASRAVPAAAAAGMGDDGKTDVAAVLGGLLRAPQELPALLRLAGDAAAARGALRAARLALGDVFGLRDMRSQHADS
ncbi:putative nucleoside phosphorylase [Cupriavidus taiwanensis]|uniref:phosphorylase n=1 Tax=Cupriavidus taiwanensis TaxID=164546 RepID=UPI000E124B5D|nr:phosphorylase [Cupriavidus taiwanensis]SOY93014.1 putative nucleoside phosphorylase [Cupriavidus taiwanensis]SOY96755.1 putative nucleoside phosphorylase [Cupriavidus taiwanensis]